jgi:UDP-glucose 4-epimerase
MKTIVTGGCGFIGSNLVDRLIKDGHDVIVIDDLSATCHDNFYYNLNAEYHKLDICDYESIRPLFEGVDFVFHMAAESRIQQTLENPIKAVKTNCVGTATVLQCATECEVKKVIYSSTSSAYGLNPPPQYEEMEENCLNPYSVSKVAGEKLCFMYKKLFGLNVIVFRYFNVYGPREPISGPYAPVIGLFLRQHKAGELLTVTGDGSQRRDFVHVSDVITANMRAMSVKHTGENVINIGTGKNYSVLEIARMISDKIQFIPARLGEAKSTQASLCGAFELLNWKPTYDVADYIKQYKVD